MPLPCPHGPPKVAVVPSKPGMRQMHEPSLSARWRSSSTLMSKSKTLKRRPSSICTAYCIPSGDLALSMTRPFNIRECAEKNRRTRLAAFGSLEI